MTEKEFNDCVNLYADNVYRFIVKNLKHEQDARDAIEHLNDISLGKKPLVVKEAEQRGGGGGGQNRGGGYSGGGGYNSRDRR